MRKVTICMPSNFLNESSGLTSSRLEEANAIEEDVKSGKTFYAGDKELKTGTLSLSGNADVSDVRSGRTFYSNSFTKRTGTMSIIGAYKIFSGQGNQTIDVRSKFPNDYQSFTTSNFIIAITEGWTSNFGENNVQVQGRCYPYRGSYNSSTGQLSVSGTPTCMYRTGGGTNVNYYQGVTRYEVYLISGITDLT